MPNNTGLMLGFVIVIILFAGHVYAQTKEVVPDPQAGVQDYSCMKYEIKSLHNAAEATDAAAADLELKHADAYARLLEMQQPC